MKKFSFNQIVLLATVAFILATNTNLLNAQALRLRNDKLIQIGWQDGYNNSIINPNGTTTYLDDPHGLTFGRSLSSNIINNPTSPDNKGQWMIEAWNKGFNISQPWPNPYYANYMLFINEMGNVGIGRGSNPACKLDVGGDIGIYGQVKVSSDKRYKKNIQPIESNIDKLLKLNGVQYNTSTEIWQKKLDAIKSSALKDAETNYRYMMDLGTVENQLREKEKDTVTHFGFIAQELRELYPNLVSEDSEGYLSVNYIGMIPVLVEAIKSQQYEIKKQQEQINELKGVSFEKNATVVISEAKLYQNNPNPFSENTEIKYYVPESSSSAMICIYDLVGSQIMKFENLSKGYSSLTVRGSELKAGMYIYALLVDGKEIDTKRMILTDK